MNSEPLNYASASTVPGHGGRDLALTLQFLSGGGSTHFASGEPLPIVAAKLEQLAQHLRGVATGAKKWGDPLIPLCSDAGTLGELKRRMNYCLREMENMRFRSSGPLDDTSEREHLLRLRDDAQRIGAQLALCMHDICFLQQQNETR